MKQKQRIEYLEASVRDLIGQIETLAAQKKTITAAMEYEKTSHEVGLKNLHDELIKAQIEASKGMAYKFKVGQLEKQISVINHITAGRANEAIQEILTPMPVMFTDVRFADAAENELLEKLKKMIIETVGGIKREAKP